MNRLIKTSMFYLLVLVTLTVSSPFTTTGGYCPCDMPCKGPAGVCYLPFTSGKNPGKQLHLFVLGSVLDPGTNCLCGRNSQSSDQQ